jgi:hypothetical protein
LNTGRQIEELYRTTFVGPFPYDDCFFLADSSGIPREDLIPELDMYFSEIAGYSSSATRLLSRSSVDLETARKTLKRGFFQRFPDLHWIQERINERDTPILFKQLKVAEELRSMLIQVLQEGEAAGY